VSLKWNGFDSLKKLLYLASWFWVLNHASRNERRSYEESHSPSRIELLEKLKKKKSLLRIVDGPFFIRLTIYDFKSIGKTNGKGAKAKKR